MRTRLVQFVAVIAGAVGLFSTALVGQTPAPRPDARTLPGTDSVKAFIAARVQKNWAPPKTPWGDPDVSGVFTTKDEANTPFERPEEWAGRTMDDITPAELAEAIVRRQEGALERGSPRVVPIHWFDNLAAMNKRPWFVIDPPEGTIPARVAGAPPEPPSQNFQTGVQLTQAQVDAADALQDNAPKDTPANRSLGDRCIALGGPWRTAGIYGNSYQIIQTPTHVVFRYEMVHEARMIPLDGRAVPTAVKQYLGVSRGWWEGNTLVVETTNLHERMRYRNSPSEGLRLVERFTRTSPTQVEWTMTIDNPAVWTRPWTYSFPMTEDNSQLIFEYACHEGNFGMANLLTAGRLLDRKTAQGER